MGKRGNLLKLAACILIAGIFDGLLTFIIADVLNIPLYLDTIGIITITFTFGGIPGLITSVFSQFFSQLIGNYLNILIFPYTLCSFAAVGVVCLFKKNISKARSKIAIVIYLSICAVLMCFVVSIVGGLINSISEAFLSQEGIGNIQTDYYKIQLYKLNFPSIVTNVFSRIPTNIIDRPISTFAGFGISLLMKKYVTKL